MSFVCSFLGHKWQWTRYIGHPHYVARVDCKRCGLTPYDDLASRTVQTRKKNERLGWRRP